MKDLIIIVNILKIIVYVFFFGNEILMLIQGLEYKFHYILILTTFLPFLIITGIFEIIGLAKMGLEEISFWWIFSVLFLFIGVFRSDIIASYIVMTAFFLGILVSSIILFKLRKHTTK